MVQSGATRLSRQEFEVIIKNYEHAGRDATHLKTALAEAYPTLKGQDGNEQKGRLTDAEIEQKILELREQSALTTGHCCICDQKGKLYSWTCQACFGSWARSILKKS